MRESSENKDVVGKKEFGAVGEDKARSFLLKKGYRWVASNFVTKWGELDLIFWDNKTLVFVEVKRRRGFQFGEPEESVTFTKQKHIIRSAIYFIQKNKIDEKPLRFDIVSVGPDGIKHIPNAFMPESEYYF